VGKLTRLQERLTREVIVGFAEKALRVILLAQRDFATEQDWDDESALLSDLTATAFVGIQDPVRDEVPKAVETCQRAGVTVRMVTGDNVVTARAIAINCGIISPSDDFLVMEGEKLRRKCVAHPRTGPEFRNQVVKADGEVDHAKLNEIWPRLRVLARCSPR